jgi:putative Mg2+ transporter-C (MgtC) family protein
MLETLAREFVEGEVLPVEVIAVRLLGAVLLCALIGLEREWTRHAAGLRTHMQVGLATALFSLISVSLIGMYEADPQATNVELDPTRILQAVGAAIAFIAAGVVVFSKGELQGLTTSAGIWVASGIGIAAGLGLWVTAAATAALAVVINFLLKPVGERIGTRAGED